MCSGPSQQEREGLPKQGLPYAGIPVPDLIPVARPVGPMDRVSGVGAEGRGAHPGTRRSVLNSRGPGSGCGPPFTRPSRPCS